MIETALWKQLKVLLFVFILTLQYRQVHSGNITEAELLHTALLTNYNKGVRPIFNQSDVVNVRVWAFLRSIQDLNELTGELSFTGALSVNWLDEGIFWDPAQYGGITRAFISYQSVWVPEIIITTTTDESDTMAKKWQKVQYSEYGEANIVVGGRILASCDVNVEKYPFDKQKCNVQFTTWGYYVYDVKLIAGASGVDTVQYSGNSVWELSKTETSTYAVANWTYYDIIFYLDRKASFTIVSLVLPLLMMSFLNVLVFVLVPDSGERVSYSVTVLLAIAVFLTIVSDALPASSEPIPIITYKLMVDMLISVLITLTTILNLRLYHKEDSKPVPGKLQSVYRFLRFNCRKRDFIKESRIGIAKEALETDNKGKIDSSEEEISNSNDSLDEEITWRDISYMVDFISLFVFSFASILSFLVFIARVTS